MKLEHFKLYIGTGVKVYFENRKPSIHELTWGNLEDAFLNGKLILKRFPENTELLDITIVEEYVQKHYDIFGYLQTGKAVNADLFNYKNMIENANHELGKGNIKKTVYFYKEAINLTDEAGQKAILSDRINKLSKEIN